MDSFINEKRKIAGIFSILLGLTGTLIRVNSVLNGFNLTGFISVSSFIVWSLFYLLALVFGVVLLIKKQDFNIIIFGTIAVTCLASILELIIFVTYIISKHSVIYLIEIFLIAVSYASAAVLFVAFYKRNKSLVKIMWAIPACIRILTMMMSRYGYSIDLSGGIMIIMSQLCSILLPLTMLYVGALVKAEAISQ